MTFAAVGSSGAITTSFSLTPSQAGDLILAEVTNQGAGVVTATALTSTNVTWTLLASFQGTTNAMTAAVFAGTVTSTSTATVTITWSGATPSVIRGVHQEFSSTVGAWALDKSGHIDSAATNTWASLTPGFGSGELYFGYAADNTTASAGSTSGYTYVANSDGHSDGMAYNPACTSAAQAPVWGDSQQQFGLMVLVYEVSAGSVTFVPPRYGQAAPPWLPQQNPYRSIPGTADTPANPPPSPLDTAWQADAGYSHLYADSHLRDRRQYFAQRPLVSDPLLLQAAVNADPLALNPEQSDSGDLWRVAAVPAFCDRREVPQQRQYYDVTLLATAQLENELLGGADTARHQMAAAYADRREVPQQRAYVSDPSAYPVQVQVGAGTTEAWWGTDTDNFYRAQRILVSGPGLLGGPVNADPLQLNPEQSPSSGLWRAAATPAFCDRRQVPQQRPYYDPSLLAAAELENELLGGGDTIRHTLAAAYADRRQVPQQPARLGADLTTAELEDELLGGADAARHWLPAAFTDRREAPQQRPYTSDPLLLTTALLEDGLLGGAGTVARSLLPAYADRREVPGQRPLVSDPLLLTTAELENELLGGAETPKYYRTPATHGLRWWMPQQPSRPADPLLIATALLENELLGGADAARHYLTSAWIDRREVPQQRLYVSDPGFYPAPVPPDITLSAWLPWWLTHNTPATHQDRRAVPEQRLYISDPSFYPTVAPTDPLTVAWGASGPYWHLYNRAAEVTDRREVPQQRNYVSDPLLLSSALLENELLGGAGAALRYLVPASHADRREVPAQRTYNDLTLLATALLENELLGAGDTARHVLAAAYRDRREVPGQRAYVSDPLLLVTAELENELLGGAGTWLRYNLPAYADRREVPQQRAYVSDPLLLATALLEGGLLGGADTARHYLAGAYIRPQPWPQMPRPADPSLSGTAPADPLTLAFGTGGTYWHLYNQAADSTERRRTPQQRPYLSGPSAYPAPDPLDTLLAGQGLFARHILSAYLDRRLVPAQRAYISDPAFYPAGLLPSGQVEWHARAAPPRWHAVPAPIRWKAAPQ